MKQVMFTCPHAVISWENGSVDLCYIRQPETSTFICFRWTVGFIKIVVVRIVHGADNLNELNSPNFTIVCFRVQHNGLNALVQNKNNL